MRKLLVFVFLFTACGDDKKEDDRLPPETGIYSVTNTLVEIDCPESSLLDFTDEAIEIYQDRSKYIIAFYDVISATRTFDIAESDDGYSFIGELDNADWLLGLGCDTSILWAILLKYTEVGFTGTIINRMILDDCPDAGSCKEKWDTEGIKIDAG